MGEAFGVASAVFDAALEVVGSEVGVGGVGGEHVPGRFEDGAFDRDQGWLLPALAGEPAVALGGVGVALKISWYFAPYGATFGSGSGSRLRNSALSSLARASRSTTTSSGVGNRS